MALTQLPLSCGFCFFLNGTKFSSDVFVALDSSFGSFAGLFSKSIGRLVFFNNESYEVKIQSFWLLSPFNGLLF